MKRIGMGIVGAGFVGPYHIEAVRRLGFVDVVALAEADADLAHRKATALGVPRAYGSYEALIADPDVHVVHNATPNVLHFPINAAVLRARKHIVSDKPLAMTAEEARRLCHDAAQAGVVHAVMFNYRGNPLVQHARYLIQTGAIGVPRFLFGHYLQDWLLWDTDYSWRLDRSKGGASAAVADIGSHWCDLVEHVSGLRIAQVLANTTTVVPRRKRPLADREAFASSSADDAYELIDIDVEDLASVLVRFDNGATGSFSVAQVAAGHKNDCALGICGSSGSIRWSQEDQNYLWIGHRDKANELLAKAPNLVAPDVRSYVRMPGGLQEGWADAFANVIKDIYAVIAGGVEPSNGLPPAVATFEDGYRANVIVEAILRSARNGGIWEAVPPPRGCGGA